MADLATTTSELYPATLRTDTLFKTNLKQFKLVSEDKRMGKSLLISGQYVPKFCDILVQRTAEQTSTPQLVYEHIL